MRITPRHFQERWWDIDALRWLVSQRLDGDLARLARNSRETTTHYKWLLASDSVERSRVWLHEFKPSTARQPGYADSVHNHRYVFNTIVLVGGYVNARYGVSFDVSSLAVQECRLLANDPIPVESAYSMAPTEYHRIRDIEDGTQTLVIELAPLSEASFSLDERSDRMVRHVPLESRVGRLRDLSGELRGLARTDQSRSR